MMLDWQKDVVCRTVECAGDYPGVMLQLLLRRLEQHPETIPAIADALEDMGAWCSAEAAGLNAILVARKAAKTGVA